MFKRVAQFRELYMTSVTFELQVSFATLFKIKNRLTQFKTKRKERGQREKQGRKERKTPQRHNKTLIMTPSILFERYR